MTIGTFILWESGTPLNEWSGSTASFLWVPMRQLGTAGRTPSILDANFRVTYELAKFMKADRAPKIFLDVFHLGSRRAPLDFDQLHYFRTDENGNSIDPNPNYLVATRYFSPMSARLGFEMGF